MIAPAQINHLPSLFDAKAAGSVACTIQFITSGPAYVTIKDGVCTVHEGHSDSPNLMVTISDDNLIALLRGKLHPATGMMMRKFKAEGDLTLGMRMSSFFDFSKMP